MTHEDDGDDDLRAQEPGRFDREVGRITGLTDWLLEWPRIMETLIGLRTRVSAQEMEVIADVVWGVYRNALAMGSRRS